MVYQYIQNAKMYSGISITDMYLLLINLVLIDNFGIEFRFRFLFGFGEISFRSFTSL